MNKKNAQKLLIIIGIPLLILILLGTFFMIYLNQIHFVYDNRSVRVVIEGQDESFLDDNGYIINYPAFRNVTSYTDQYLPIYTEIANPISVYVYDIVDTYSNYAKLDYEVEIVKNQTLTVCFVGYGYPDEGKGEPVSLDRSFVFDINDVGVNRLPVLLN